MRRISNIGLVIGMTVALMVGGLLAITDVMAAEIHFVAGELSKDHAIWHPGEVIIDGKTDLKDGLVFVLENPTNLEHAFAVQGLMEETTEKRSIEVTPGGGDVEMMDFKYRPIRVTLPPHTTKRIRVGTEPLEGAQAEGRRFRYFCPIHKDMHLAGSIYVAR